MANSKYEYVRSFEHDEHLLPNTWIVVRIDGRGFHKLSNLYNFTKPNDRRALQLMNRAAQSVFHSVPDICLAYGVSDEYSFILHKSTTLFERRASKIVTTVVSSFTAAYIFHWTTYFPPSTNLDQQEHDENDIPHPTPPLQENWLPTFDGRAVCYPSLTNLRDYLSWRQVDCHINNLYNTTFWTLVQKGKHSTVEAEMILKGTIASDKNEILFSRFGINYNNEEDMYKKGSVVFREYRLVDPPTGSGVEMDEKKPDERRYGTDVVDEGDLGVSDGVEGRDVKMSKTQVERARKARQKAKVVVEHVDIIKDEFWHRRPWILSGKPGVLVPVPVPVTD